MQDLNDLYYYAQVVEHGGFAAAARATDVQKSKLSRRIQQLEDRLGVRLLSRSSRRFSVTEIGREYYDRCVAMLVEAEAADQVIAQVRSEPRGVIRVSCPVALINFQLGALFARFLAAYPAVDIHLESTNRRVDVIAEGLDIAIRVRFPPLEPTDLVMHKLPFLDLPPRHHRWQLYDSHARQRSIAQRRHVVCHQSRDMGDAGGLAPGMFEVPLVVMLHRSQCATGQAIEIGG